MGLGQDLEEVLPFPAFLVGEQPEARGPVFLKMIPPHQGHSLPVGLIEQKLGGQGVAAEVHQDGAALKQLLQERVAEISRKKGEIELWVQAPGRGEQALIQFGATTVSRLIPRAAAEVTKSPVSQGSSPHTPTRARARASWFHPGMRTCRSRRSSGSASSGVKLWLSGKVTMV